MKYSLILLVFLFASCTTRSYDLVVDQIDIKELISEVKENESSFNSLKAFANISIQSKQEKIFFDQVTIVKKPDLLRLEALAAFGTTVAQVLSNGSKIHFITRSEKLVFDNTDDFSFSYIYPDLPSNLNVNNLVNVLLGSAPFNVWNDPYSIQFSGVKNSFSIIFERKDDLKFDINTKYKVIEKVSYKLHNGDEVEIEFSNFTSVEDKKYFPMNILIKSSEYILMVKYDDKLSLNESLGISLFQPSM